MTKMLRSGWEKIKKQRRVAIAVIIVIMVAVVVIVVCIRFNVTGLNEYTQVSTIRTLRGPTAGTVTRTETSQPGKTLWDWMQLLIIPAVLAIGGYLFNYTTTRNEHEIASDNQREAALQAYIDKVSELLLHEHLSETPTPHEVEVIARARTATVLRILDPVRRGSLIRFLNEANILKNLVEEALESIDLHGADLSGVNLRHTYLFKANLSRANLYGTDLGEANLKLANLKEAFLEATTLFETNLESANLEGANLELANLFGANLKVANLLDAIVEDEGALVETYSLKGATMPDGSIHP